MIVLSSDPGERNYAYSVIAIERSGVRILETDMLTETIVNLTSNSRKMTKSAKGQEPDLAESMARFKLRIEGIHNRWKIDHVVAERFQTRGIKSRSTETVSMMNAVNIMIAKNRGASFRLIMAADWKVWIGKIIPLDLLYAEGKALGLTNHTVDTLGIALNEYVRFLTDDAVLTPANLLKIVRNCGQKFVRNIGVRTKVKVLYKDGKYYPAIVEKVTPTHAIVRWYDGLTTARVLLEDVKPY